MIRRLASAALVTVVAGLLFAAAPGPAGAQVQEYEDWEESGIIRVPNPLSKVQGINELIRTMTWCGDDVIPTRPQIWGAPIDGAWLDVPTEAQGKSFFLHPDPYYMFVSGDDVDIAWYDKDCRYISGNFTPGPWLTWEFGVVPAGAEWAAVNLANGPICQPGVTQNRCAQYFLTVYDVFPVDP